MPISKELQEQLDKSKPAKGFRQPVFFNRKAYFSDGTKASVVIKRVYADEPLITHEDGHEEDTGWYFPVKEEVVVMGNAKQYEKRISQAEYQNLKKV